MESREFPEFAEYLFTVSEVSFKSQPPFLCILDNIHWLCGLLMPVDDVQDRM